MQPSYCFFAFGSESAFSSSDLGLRLGWGLGVDGAGVWGFEFRGLVVKGLGFKGLRV